MALAEEAAVDMGEGICALARLKAGILERPQHYVLIQKGHVGRVQQRGVTIGRHLQDCCTVDRTTCSSTAATTKRGRLNPLHNEVKVVL